MKPNHVYLLITTIISFALGCTATAVVVNSQNGYVGAMDFFLLMILVGAASLVLILIGLVTIAKKAGPFLLLAALLLPVSFFGSAFTAKYFGLGAYHEEPMTSMTPAVSNIVLFKQGTTNDDISRFLDETLSTVRADGRGSLPLPAVMSKGQFSVKDGREGVEFSFFPGATDEQRNYVYSRVRSSPIVFSLIENAPVKDYMPPEDLPSNDNRPTKELRIGTVLNRNQ